MNKIKIFDIIEKLDGKRKKVFVDDEEEKIGLTSDNLASKQPKVSHVHTKFSIQQYIFVLITNFTLIINFTKDTVISNIAMQIAY